MSWQQALGDLAAGAAAATSAWRPLCWSSGLVVLLALVVGLLLGCCCGCGWGLLAGLWYGSSSSSRWGRVLRATIRLAAEPIAATALERLKEYRGE